jgi:hypothetical protein
LPEDRFETWLRALETQHLSELTFPEISRALRALSSAYVERRARLQEGAALAGAGKRAAFALFYGPLHFLLVRHIVGALGAGAITNATRSKPAPTLVDLGCGTGAAGAAWASAFDNGPQIIGIDRHPWAVDQAAQTYRHFGLKSRTQRGDISTAAWPKPPAAFVTAFTLNEMVDAERDAAVERLLERAGGGDQVLIVEPIAGAVAPWWDRWRRAFEKRGGRADEWRFNVDLPTIVAKLDRAAGLNHRELTGRSLSVGLWSAPTAPLT